MARIDSLAMAGVDCDRVVIDIDALEKAASGIVGGADGNDGGTREAFFDVSGGKREAMARLTGWAKTAVQVIQKKFPFARKEEQRIV